MQPRHRQPTIALRRAVGVVSAALALSMILPAPAAAQAPPSSTDTSRGLSMLFADGRRLTRPLRPSAVMATTGFPTIPGRETSRDGAPLTGYRVAYVMDGADAVVTVSIQFGTPRKALVEVATLRVTAGTPVAMNELRT